MQTWIVHMRRPGVLCRQLGLRGFLGFQLLIGGMVMSAFLHPLFFVILAGQVIAGDVFLGRHDWVSAVVIGIGAFNLAVGYVSAFALAIAGLSQRPMRHMMGEIAWLPVYWLFISVSAYRAAWELARRPFHWEKTAHGLCRAVAPVPRLR